MYLTVYIQSSVKSSFEDVIMPVSMAVNVTSLVLLIVKKARVTYKVELVSRVTLGGRINFAIKVVLEDGTVSTVVSNV